jgi:hypothetical protein
MQPNILVQLFTARIVKIFLEFSGAILNLFWAYFGAKIGFLTYSQFTVINSETIFIFLAVKKCTRSMLLFIHF